MQIFSGKKKYWFIGFLVLIIGGAILAKPIVEKIIKEKAQEALTQNYGAQVNISSVELGIFDQKIVIKGLELTHPYKPKRNIIDIPETSMQFKLEKYFSDKIVYLDQAQLLNVKVDALKASGKEGWVDRKKYPKAQAGSFDLKKIDLKALKADFKDNFTSELKQTAAYKDYKQSLDKYENLIEGKYKAEYKELESQIKDLKGLKLDAKGIKQGLLTLKSVDDKYSTLKNIGGELRALKLEVSLLNEKLNKSQQQILSRFLDKHGLSNVGEMFQQNIEALLMPSQKNEKKPTQQKVEKKVAKSKPSGAREDILFFVNKIVVKGEQDKFKGEVSKFNNLAGEAPNLWEGLISLNGEVIEGAKTNLKAQGKSGGWDIDANLADFSLSQFDFIDKIDIDKGFLDLKLSGSLKDAANISGVLDLNLKKLSSELFKKYGKWGDLIEKALVSNPFKVSFKGFTPQIETQDFDWNFKWLSSAPDLVHPLKNEAKQELSKVAQLELNKLKAKIADIPEVQKLKDEADRLKNKFKKDSTSNLLKGLLKKL